MNMLQLFLETLAIKILLTRVLGSPPAYVFMALVPFHAMLKSLKIMKKKLEPDV